MEQSQEIVDGVGVLTITGQIDALSAPGVGETLNALIGQQNGKVAVDLSAVDYVSSAGLRVLLAGLKSARAIKDADGQAGDVRIAGLQPQVKEVFDIAGFTPLFHIYNDVDAAVNSFS